VIWKYSNVVFADDAFPLTLTLSLGEREQPTPLFRFSEACAAKSVAGFIECLATILPLLAGEGRGKGEMHDWN
jgi:hypothetical protein